jgi:hypothetical protein
VHPLVDVHATPVSWLPPAGLALRWIDHFLPFQRSTSPRLEHGALLCGSEQPGPVCQDPTAVHALPTVHETPLNPVKIAPAGLGVGSIDHFVPFQRWTNGSWEQGAWLIEQPAPIS